MNDPADGKNTASKGVAERARRYYKRDFWSTENLRYDNPHFRLAKAAEIISKLAGGRERTLLDVGCGPAALMHVLPPNISYYGVDIAIPEPAPNLAEADLLETPIGFGGEKFDMVLAQGFFEYMGEFQSRKFSEIAGLLKQDSVFIATYVNFGHRSNDIYFPYNNVQPVAKFREDLARHFRIERSFPTSHNWKHTEPNRKLLRAANMKLNVNIPVVSPKLAVEYFFICSPLGPAKSGSAPQNPGSAP